MYIEMPVRYSSLFPSLFYFDSVAMPLLLSHLSEWIKEHAFKLRCETAWTEIHANENKLEKLKVTSCDCKGFDCKGFSNFSAQYLFQLP